MGTLNTEFFFCFRCLIPSQSKYLYFLIVLWSPCTELQLLHYIISLNYTLFYSHYSLCFSKDKSTNYRIVSQQPESLQLTSWQVFSRHSSSHPSCWWEVLWQIFMLETLSCSGLDQAELWRITGFSWEVFFFSLHISWFVTLEKTQTKTNSQNPTKQPSN